jgi:hypothetical protein
VSGVWATSFGALTLVVLSLCCAVVALYRKTIHTDGWNRAWPLMNARPGAALDGAFLDGFSVLSREDINAISLYASARAVGASWGIPVQMMLVDRSDPPPRWLQIASDAQLLDPTILASLQPIVLPLTLFVRNDRLVDAAGGTLTASELAEHFAMTAGPLFPESNFGIETAQGGRNYATIDPQAAGRTSTDG